MFHYVLMSWTILHVSINLGCK